MNVLVSLVEFERVLLLGSTFAGQEIIYPVGGRWVGAFSRWVGGRWVGGRWFYNNPSIHKNNERFYRKVAFLTYTESVN